MRLLITGAGGQLGRALQAALRDHSVVALDHAGLDITRLAPVRAAIRTYRPQLVINAAAFNAVDAAQTEVAAAYGVNALGPRNLAVATAAEGIALLHVSTDYVFDGTASRPYHEFDCPNPRSVYGASKLAGERTVRSLNHRHYIVRTAWLYDNTGRNFPNTMLRLAQQPPVRVVNDQYGSPTFAPHLAEAIGQLIETDAFGTYHLAGRGGTNWFELARSLYQALEIATPVQPVPTSEFPHPAPRPAYSVLTTLQDPCILLPPWEEGLKAFVEAVRDGRVR